MIVDNTRVSLLNKKRSFTCSCAFCKNCNEKQGDAEQRMIRMYIDSYICQCVFFPFQAEQQQKKCVFAFNGNGEGGEEGGEEEDL